MFEKLQITIFAGSERRPFLKRQIRPIRVVESLATLVF